MKQSFFTFRELIESITAGALGIDNVPDFEVIGHLYDLVKYVLTPCRQYIGRPIYINSGYRSIKLNAIVGGVPTSQHIEGKAADITTASTKDNNELFRFIVEKMDFDQCIRYKTFIHISYNGKLNRNQVIDKVDKESYYTKDRQSL